MSETISSSIQDHSEFQRVLSALRTNNTKKVRGVTKSFRLDEDIIRIIAQQAENNNTSLNTEINNALRKYIRWDMFAGKGGMIPITRPVLSDIFQRILTKEEVIDLANLAKNAIPETVYFMKGNLTLESFLSWLKTRMEHCSEVNYTQEENSGSGPKIKMIFKHDLGENWSIYHKIITEYVFKEILKINSYETHISATALTLCFKQMS